MRKPRELRSNLARLSSHAWASLDDVQFVDRTAFRLDPPYLHARLVQQQRDVLDGGGQVLAFQQELTPVTDGELFASADAGKVFLAVQMAEADLVCLDLLNLCTEGDPRNGDVSTSRFFGNDFHSGATMARVVVCEQSSTLCVHLSNSCDVVIVRKVDNNILTYFIVKVNSKKQAIL